MNKKLTFLLATISLQSFASGIKIEDINTYAYEGISKICRDSRNITEKQHNEINKIYYNLKHKRQKSLPSDSNFSYYAAKQLWNISIDDSPSYSHCLNILSKVLKEKD